MTSVNRGLVVKAKKVKRVTIGKIFIEIRMMITITKTKN